MSPFDQNIDYDAGHAINPSIDQDDLIAFHLHELTPPQERALHRVLKTNPALQSESVAIATTLRAFPKYEPALPLDAAALDRHWQALRPSLSIHVPSSIAPRSLFHRSLFTRWALPALAGSALVATVLLVSLHHNPHTSPVTVATTQTPASTASSLPLTAPTTTAPTIDTTLTASTQRPWINNPINSVVNSLNSNQTDNPSSFPPSASTQTALSNPTPNLPPTEPLIPTLPTQVSPAITPNTTTATTESPSPQSTSPTSSPSPTQLTKLRPPTIHHPRTTDLTLAILGNLTPDRSSTSGDGGSAPTGSFTQSTTPAVGALASFHQQLHPWLGYRITTTYSRPTFEYTDATPDSSGVGIAVNERIYEFSGTYVVQGPHRHRITTSAEAGAGLLAFLPTDPNGYGEAASNTVRPTGVIGVSTDIALTKHWALHAGYRALLYKAPAYYSTAYGASLPAAPTNLTLSNEPVIGITYRFGATGED